MKLYKFKIKNGNLNEYKCILFMAENEVIAWNLFDDWIADEEDKGYYLHENWNIEEVNIKKRGFILADRFH